MNNNTTWTLLCTDILRGITNSICNLYSLSQLSSLYKNFYHICNIQGTMYGIEDPIWVYLKLTLTPTNTVSTRTKVGYPYPSYCLFVYVMCGGGAAREPQRGSHASAADLYSRYELRQYYATATATAT